MDTSSTDQYDVAIVGCGFEGSLIGIILGYQGKKVLMIDSGIHPRFALGESTVRHTFKLLKIIGARFEVPELVEKFSRAELLHKHVASTFGHKTNFGFVYHREGQHQIPTEANQVVIAPFREGYEAHLFRQDVDSFLTYTAVHYGADVRYKTLIKTADVDKEGVTLTSATGETFRARYLVDAAGPGAFLARQFNVREDPPRLKLNTRCLFTHMIDVKAYDDLHLPYGVPKMPERFYSGTCHHVFDGGWLWVIPFDNREGSTNDVCSVGLSLDNERFPKPKDKTPEQEWQEFLARFPSIYEQFKDARPVRDWVSSDRLQSSCSQTVGERWCITAAANGSGFLDALYSRGLSNSCEFVNAFTPRLLRALDDDDFSVERFAYLETLQQHNISYGDRLVGYSYAAFRDYDLWNAWVRVWALGEGMGDLWLANALRKYETTKDESYLPDAMPPRISFTHLETFDQLFEDSAALVEAVEQGRLDAKDAAKQILTLIKKSNLSSPVVKLSDPTRQYVNVAELKALVGTLYWIATAAPDEIKQRSVGSFSDIPKRFVARFKGRGAQLSPEHV